MANLLGFPIIRGVNFAGGYKVLGKRSLSVVGSMLFDVQGRVLAVGWSGTNSITNPDESATGSGSYNYVQITVTSGYADHKGTFTANRVAEVAIADYHQLQIHPSQLTKSLGVHRVRVSHKVKPYNQDYVGLAFYDTTYSNSYRIVFDIATGAVTSNESYGSAITAFAPPEIKAVGNGFYEISLVPTIDTAETTFYTVLSSLKSPTGYADNLLGDVTKGFYVLDSSVNVQSASKITLTGASVTLTYAQPPKTITVTTGAITLTGTSVALRMGRKLTYIDNDSWIVYTAGTSAALKFTRKITTTSSVVSATGTSVALRATRKITANTATITATGTSVNEFRGLRIVQSTATITTAGAPAALRATRQIGATTQSVTLTGAGVTLRMGRQVIAGTAAVAITGAGVTLRATRQLTTTTTQIVAVGTSAALSSSRRIAANTNSIILSGAAVLRATRSLTATTAQAQLTGSSVLLSLAGTFVVISGTITLTGANVNMDYVESAKGGEWDMRRRRR